MKFVVNIGKLRESLEPVETIATKNVLKDFDRAEKLTLKAEDDSVVALSFGGACAIAAQVSNSTKDDLEYDCEESGVITVNAKDFMNCLRSFAPNEKVIVSSTDKDGGAVKMVLERDKRQTQGCPLLQEHISMPGIASSFSLDVEVDKEIFLQGMNKVNFAIGYQDTRPIYLNQLVDVEKDKMTFIAGTGGKFAYDTIEGKSLTNSIKKERLIFPKKCVELLMGILKKVPSDIISIKEGQAENANKHQLCISFDIYTMIALGVDVNIKKKYAQGKIEKIVNYEHPNSIEVDLQDWIYPTKGIRTTYGQDMQSQGEIIHSVEMNADYKENCFHLKVDQPLSSSRVINFKNVVSRADDDVVELYYNSTYMEDILKRPYSNGDIRFRFKDNSSPIVVDFPELTNDARGTIEKFVMFFATTKKE